ncbi:OLC1v1021832C2 [Oldenlandia corymbosa var. corymbosa]|uniref:OLC1v1021832C2 n=1 Tax=Oldenlandia corymbosa var. corymbosa TaxID=529605 RepID=A0AAV1BWJ3_OLDCO|nr:OLC1v1021832C2 [Oldenlandia corymbosa var. corymbosa]
MADEYYQLQAETTWWMNPPIRSSMMFGSSPCSSSAGGINLDLGSFGWPTSTDFLDIKTTTTTTTTRCSPDDHQSHNNNNSSANSDGSSSIVIQDLQKPNSDSATSSMDSALQIIATSLGLPSSTTSTTTADWDSALIHGGNGRPDHQQAANNYQNSSMNYRQEIGIDQNCTSDHHDHLQIQNNFAAPPAGFPMNPASYGYPSNLLQTLFDSEPQPQQQQVIESSLYTNHRAMNNNYQTSLNNELPPASLPKFNPMQQKLQLPNNLPFSATPGQNFVNGSSSAAALNDLRASFFSPTVQSQFLSSTFSEKANLPNLTAKVNSDEVVQSLGTTTAKKSGSTEPAFKRPRIETPTPLPTFKVRKEKLGDRITALQQLVSPFGKTDTASVLHEAIEYIKFLHDQVNVLSTPYMKNGSPVHHRQQVGIETYIILRV